jgi:type I restriction enzyme S subunit
MANDWLTLRLTELGELNRGKSRHRPRNASHLYDGPYPFVQTGDIRSSNGFITKHSQTYSEAGLAQSRLWPKDTLAITIAANIAESALLTYPACFPDSVVGFVADSKICDIRFVDYLFRNKRHELQNEHVGTGSVQDNINLEILGQIEFQVPPLPEQRAIAHILGTLDDKIEINRKQNETLEAMASALFKAWFVDFEPVRAKQEGRWLRGQSLPGLPAHLYDLFPDRLVESELGEIPEGWVNSGFSDTVEIIGGGTPKTSVSEYWDGEIPWFSVVDTPASSDVFAVQTQKSITLAGLNGSSARLIPKGTTIISARGTVGNLAIAGCDMAFNQSCYALQGKSGSGSYFVFLSAQRMIEHLRLMAHGSVFSTITRHTFEAVRVVLPTENLRLQFERSVASVLDRVLGNVNESRSLAQLRDTLLPQLISGELRVPDAQRILDRNFAC